MLMDTTQVAGVVDCDLNVLLIDNDRVCLTILDKMLQSFNFIVTKCQGAKEALSSLLEGPKRFDIIISDLHMSDIDGFELLKQLMEADRPVIVTSSDDNEHLIRKAILSGASDYLVKPVRLEQIKHVWKYVYQAQRHDLNMNKTRPTEQFGVNYCEDCNTNIDDRITITPKGYSDNPLGVNGVGSSDEQGSKCTMKKRKRAYGEENMQESNSSNTKEGDAQVNDEASTTTTTTTTAAAATATMTITTNARKKQRVIWTPDLHDKFVAAVNQFGTSKAVPKKILELMNVPGLTRENVASHLQKYRQYHKKIEQNLQQQSENLVSLMPSQEQQCFQRISPGSVGVSDEVSFNSVQASDMVQPPNIVEDMKKEMQIHASSNEIDTYGNQRSDIVMPMAVGEAGNEVHMMNYHDYVASYAYSIADSRCHLVETPHPNWVSGFAYDENGVQNEVEIASMAFGQPYGYGDVSHAMFGTDSYGNTVDLGNYRDPYAGIYVEPFEQNDDYMIRRLQQQGFGHTLDFGGHVDH